MRLSILGPAAVLAFSLISVTGCSGGGSGCGPSEEELDEQASAGTQRVTVTCGPGTRLEGNVCVRNTGTTGSSNQPTTLTGN